MRPPLRPPGEARRLHALRRYNLLDTLPEPALDDLTALAAHICDAPISMISLVDGERQWFKSKIGLSASETARDVSFCGHAILQPDLFIVPDAAADERFADNPLVMGDPRIRFYAGAPLVTPEGDTLGTLCVIDHVARQLTPSQAEALRVLSRQVMAQFELRRQAHELKERDERFQIVARATNDAVWDWNLGTDALWWNEGYQALFGYLPEEIDPGIDSWVNFIHPDDVERVRRGIRAAIDRGDQAWSDEYRFRRRDGTYAEIFDRGHISRDAKGTPVRMVGAMQDVTGRKRAEAAERTSEERYRALFEYAPDGIVIADRESNYVDANASICRMLGYSFQELIGLHASDIVAQAEVQHIGPALTTIKASSGYHREWRFRRKDGSVFPAEVIATTMPDGNLMGMVRDVTERNVAIEALRTAEERMRFALQSAEVGIWDMDYATGALGWSAILEAQYGLQPGTFGGTFEAFVGLIHPDDRASVLETVERATKSGADFSVMHRSTWPDGSVHWLSGAGRIHLDEHGKPARSVGISLDVTERRLLEDQYQQAQKMEAIGRLAGGVAHDFNNLLTAILGYCELLLADLGPDDPHRADITEIQKAGERAAGLTRQLLAFSRKQIIEPMRLDLNAVVANMRAMLGRLIEEDVKIVQILRPELAPVIADRGQVEQIVLNLAVNARDAMPNGGTLTIETANLELGEHDPKTLFALKPGSYVVLTVTDTGTGMTPAVQARLFEPFFTTKEAGKGTGLGLATVHGIVARFGGSVDVDSEVGRGTSFKVYLPRAEGVDPVVEAARPEARSEARPLAGTETVLVVEDADGLRDLAGRLLERQGYTVLLAANAHEALQLFDRHTSIDVVLTDVVMPGTSGPALARRLAERRPGLKIIYMSGYTEDAIAHHGVIDPGIAFLHKPFTADALARKIRDVLDR